MLSTVNKTIKLKLTKIVKKNYLISKKKFQKKWPLKKKFSNNSTTSEKFPKWRTSNYEKKIPKPKTNIFFLFPSQKKLSNFEKKISKKMAAQKNFPNNSTKI